MGNTGRAVKHLDHDPLPLHAMRPNTSRIHMMNNPVGHFMRHHLGKKGLGLLGIQRHVKAQTATTIMSLPGTASTQITPDPGRRQRRIANAGLHKASFDMSQKPGAAGIAERKVINVAGREIGHG